MPKPPLPPTDRRAQVREQAEPSEQSQPIPRLFLIFSVLLLMWGAGYIVFSGPFGEPVLGDKRTVADLASPAAGAKGSVNGQQLYTANCVACHQATGKGLPGVFPPLDGSEWVIGDERVMANILLHGVSGDITVMGAVYKGAMPAFKQLSDAELAGVASFVRASWSNKAPAIAPALVEAERKANLRAAPFAGGDDLKKLIAKGP
jgi:mono/diheme cytochrome c family protein